MSMREEGRSGGRNIWVFMAATAMATTVSTLAATAMVQAESAGAQALEVTCDCEAPETPRCDSTREAGAVPEAAPVPEADPAPEAETEAADPERAPSSTSTVMKAEGALDKAVIRRVVRAHIDEIRYCYNQGLQRDSDLAGRVEIQFTIGPSGKVPVAVVAQSTLPDDSVASCMTEAVRRWEFPKPSDGQAVTVTYPFVLEPG